MSSCKFEADVPLMVLQFCMYWGLLEAQVLIQDHQCICHFWVSSCKIEVAMKKCLLMIDACLLDEGKLGSSHGTGAESHCQLRDLLCFESSMLYASLFNEEVELF